jgi:hypothetical protein
MLRVTGGSVRAPCCWLLWSLLLLAPALLETRRGSLPCSDRADAGLLVAAGPADQQEQPEEFCEAHLGWLLVQVVCNSVGCDNLQRVHLMQPHTSGQQAHLAVLLLLPLQVALKA